MDLGIRQIRWSVATLLLALITAACSPSGTDQTTVPDDPTTVTSAPDPVPASIQIFAGTLTLNDEETQNFERIEIGEGAEIISHDEVEDEAGEKAHAQIELGDEYTIEMFMGASLRVDTLEPPELGIYLYRGHIAVTRKDQTSPQLKVVTESADIKTVEGGADFTLCQPVSLETCLVVQEGVVEMTSAGATATYTARQGTEMTAMFLDPGKPPGAERCVGSQVYDDWFEQARVNDAENPLRALVGASPFCSQDQLVVAVQVAGDVLWTDTEVDVEVGDTLRIEGVGAVQHGTTTGFYGPAGNPDVSRTNNVPGLEDENHSALIGRIGDGGAAFLVGSEREITVETAGRLFLGVNDIDVDNNAGAFGAVITVTHSSGDP